MMYKCVAAITLLLLDKNECLVEGEERTIPEGSSWEVDEYTTGTVMDGVRLNAIDQYSPFAWVDVPKECLGTDFVLIAN